MPGLLLRDGRPWRTRRPGGPAPADRIADERVHRTDVYSGTGLTGAEVVRDTAARLAGRITVVVVDAETRPTPW
ncbi:hypothetical protein [Amycolatopsis sp. lyj-346]|uniref:hypothetical protein n=1 Tax=Amycolatopsis sp. lyj-346 TaxID=2789289 RepID=UPI00397B78F8